MNSMPANVPSAWVGVEEFDHTVSLGSTPIGAVMLRDLRRILSASSRI